MRSVARLVELSAGPLSAGPVSGLPEGQLGMELAAMLSQLNGFVAFESALMVRGAGSQTGDLSGWNAPDGWRAAYGGLAEGLFFFAEDAFGGQFGLLEDTVVSFDPETGEVRPMAHSLDGWAALVLGDVEMLTGYPLVAEWQSRHGMLCLGQRLVPVIPFVLGGAFDVDNVIAVDDERGMRLRGDLALQLRGVPDGTPIRYSVGD